MNLKHLLKLLLIVGISSGSLWNCSAMNSNKDDDDKNNILLLYILQNQCLPHDHEHDRRHHSHGDHSDHVHC